VIDGVVNGIGKAAYWSGGQIRKLHTGLIHDYMLFMVTGLTTGAILLAWLVL